MANVSQRSLYAYESPIRKLMKYANAAKKKGIRVFHLNIGQPDVASPVHPRDVLTDWDLNHLPYGKSEGEESMQQAFLEYYRNWNIDLDPEDILVTTGASEALLFSIFATMDQGDELIVQEPFYANYNGISQMAGVKIKPIHTPFDEGFPIPSMRDFEAVLTPKSKALLLCNPNNPTGKVYSREMLLQLAELVIKYDLFLIVDEVYREFCYELDFYSVLEMDHIKDRVIILDSISKRYNACGARIGCIVTRNAHVREMVLKYAQLRLSPPMLGQKYAELAINPSEEFMSSMVEVYRARRAYVVERLTAIPGVVLNEPEGAFYIFAKLPVDDTEEFCKWLLTDFQIDGKTVMMAPGNGFYATEGLGRDQIRLAYVLDLPNLEQALDCLEEGLRSYPFSRLNEAYTISTSANDA
ncbi:MAG TPA: pyridoxal phosphate-dependent aminotransferase [Membranihabitans sp.]|nr:pyridoxal phosphate-dependent aminotransferase [Membranihabitans sp.]